MSLASVVKETSPNVSVLKLPFAARFKDTYILPILLFEKSIRIYVFCFSISKQQ